MQPRLIEVELHVRDLDRSIRFYRDALGVPVGESEVHDADDVRHAHAVWGSWDAGADLLMLNLYPARPGEEWRTSIGFAVDDLDAIHERLAHGRAEVAEVVEAPAERPWGRTAVYLDPDGNRVSLTSAPTG